MEWSQRAVEVEKVELAAADLFRLFQPRNDDYQRGAGQFVSGLREAAVELTNSWDITYQGIRLLEIADALLAQHGENDYEPVIVRLGSDPLHGTGAPLYRALAQAIPDENSAFLQLKAILLCLVIERDATPNAVSLSQINDLATFLNFSGSGVSRNESVDCRSLLAELPRSLDVEALLTSLRAADKRYQSINDRLSGLGRAIESFTRIVKKHSPPKRRIAPRLPFVRSADSVVVAYGVGATYADCVTAPVMSTDHSRQSHLDQIAETVEDALDVSVAVLSEDDIGLPFHALRAAARHQRSDFRAGFWARCQWDALTPCEMRQAVSVLLTADRGTHRVERSRIGECVSFGLMMAATGFSSARCHLIRTKFDPDLEYADVYDAVTGTLTMPLPGGESRFSPSPEQQGLLAKTTHGVRIRLPAEIVGNLRQQSTLADGYLFVTDLESLESSLREMFTRKRIEEPRLTLARMRRGHQLELLAQTGDVAVAQLLASDTLGAAASGTAYYSAPLEALQSVYDRTVESAGLTPSGAAVGQQEFVGSKLCLTPEAIRSVVIAAHAGLLYRPRSAEKDKSQTLHRHDQLVKAVALQWMAATGFRPTFRIGHLRVSSISMDANLAVIADKVTDEGHLGRLVPIAPLLKQTLASFLVHLSDLASSANVPRWMRQAASDARSGHGSLFFVTSSGGVRKLEPADLRDRLPRRWCLPLNFLRHRLATRLREEGCPGSYVQALMGHHEVGIQPFGEESFMLPTEYVQRTSAFIQRILELDGWRVLQGNNPRENVALPAQPALGDDVCSVVERYESAVRRRHERQRKDVALAQATASDSTREHVRTVVHQLAPELIERPDEKHSIAPEQVLSLRRAVCVDAMSLADIELRIRALRDLLKEGRQAFNWTISRLPSFYQHSTAPSAHHESMVPAYNALLALRRLMCIRLKQSPDLPQREDHLLNLVLALMLWHGVAEISRLQRILQGHDNARPLKGTKDAWVIPTLIAVEGQPGKPSAEVVRGPVALALKSSQRFAYQSTDLQTAEGLLSSWMPKSIVDVPPHKVLQTVLAIAAIGHRFESPPPLRLVWSGEIFSVGLSADRVITLFGGPRATGALSMIENRGDTTVNEHAESTLEGQSPHPVQEKSRYRRLLKILRYKPGRPKTFPDSEEELSILTSSFEIRRATLTYLEADLFTWNEDHSFMRALFSYAFDCLRNGTPWHKRIEQSTVYKYVVGAGASILRMGSVLKLDEMDGESFSQLYEDCLLAVPAGCREDIRSYLYYFHLYLVKVSKAPPIAMRIAGSSALCIPDVGLVTPNEMAVADAAISARLNDRRPTAASNYVMLGTRIAMLIGLASGARTREVFMRERRELRLLPDQTALLIHRNRFDRIKTQHSNRIVPLNHRMPIASLNAVKEWVSDRGASDVASDDAMPLFPAPGSNRSFINTDVAIRTIGEILRSVTGQADARPYWWRHSQISLDALLVFGDPILLADLQMHLTVEGRSWLIDVADLRLQLGGNNVLGQSHAAGFRSLRGHSRMRTSIETYVHTASLVEPWASRTATDNLNSTSLARLAGIEGPAVRQRLARAGISAKQGRAAATLLLAIQGVDKHEEELVTIPDVKTRLPPTAIADAILQALCLRNWDVVRRSLALTPGTSALLALQLDKMISSAGLLFDSASSAIPAPCDRPRKRSVRMRLGLEQLNPSWLRERAIRIASNTHASSGIEDPLWANIVRGWHQSDGMVYPRDVSDMETLLDRLPTIFAESNDQQQFRLQVRANFDLRTETSRAFQSCLAKIGTHNIALIRSDVRPRSGELRVALSIWEVGRRRKSSVAWLALACTGRAIDLLL